VSIDGIEPGRRVGAICEALGLSRVIGDGLVRRALETAGVFDLDSDGLAHALPVLEARLRPFLPDASSADAGFLRLRRLAGL
jgi:hypothetical protein